LTDPGSIESGRFLRSADPPIRLEQGPEWGITSGSRRRDSAAVVGFEKRSFAADDWAT
jgi:hypothetical protein